MAYSSWSELSFQEVQNKSRITRGVISRFISELSIVFDICKNTACEFVDNSTYTVLRVIHEIHEAPQQQFLLKNEVVFRYSSLFTHHSSVSHSSGNSYIFGGERYSSPNSFSTRCIHSSPSSLGNFFPQKGQYEITRLHIENDLIFLLQIIN